jgi:hypothetical protein
VFVVALAELLVVGVELLEVLEELVVVDVDVRIVLVVTKSAIGRRIGAICELNAR